MKDAPPPIGCHYEQAMQDAMDVFMRYGYRKTSMNDVAGAIGISRQALYKRHKTKDALFRATVKFWIERSEVAGYEALNDKNLSLENRLHMAMDIWCGQHVDDLRASPHSHEIIALANVQAKDMCHKLWARINRRIGEALQENLGEADAQWRDDAVLTIGVAAEGLLHTAENHAEFDQGMRAVLRLILGTYSGGTAAPAALGTK